MRGLWDREEEGGRDLREAIEGSESADLRMGNQYSRASQELLVVDIRQPRVVLLADEPCILSTV